MDPDEPIIDRRNDYAAILAEIRRGQQAIVNGDVVAHEDMKRRLSIRDADFIKF